MVCIVEKTGFVCVFIIYVTIAISNIAFIKVAVLEDVKRNDSKLSYINIFFYEVLIILVIWSHLKTMLSQPGYVPNKYLQYDVSKFPETHKLMH